jgi:hypothetical protein
MIWNYGIQDYANSRKMREVLSRDFRKASGAALVSYVFTHPSSATLKYHERTSLADPSGDGRKRWNFSIVNNFTQGLLTKFVEQVGPSTAWTDKTVVDNTWAQSGSNNVYIQESLTTIDVGTAFQKQSKVVISGISNTGAVTESKTFGYASLSTEQKKVNCSYYPYNLLRILPKNDHRSPL